ncbi:hypothetical protein [Curtobacterium sp. RRHDQ10]|uniref:hypothetical protein n=1 Tax=Curtobacterium phyllosphaerae TaxID=3413379 RepID=UPI003BF20A7D
MATSLDTFFNGMSAVATAGALIAAIYAGWQARQLFGVETTRDDDQRRRDGERQASGVTAWAGLQLLTRDRQVMGVVVRNSSDDPVFDVDIRVRGFSRPSVSKLRILPPGEYFIRNDLHTDPDGRTFHWDWAKPVREFRDPLRPYTAGTKFAVEQIGFRDSAGHGWTRDESGRLQSDSTPTTSTRPRGLRR